MELFRKNVLYGGIPPFTWYVNYVGRPIYKSVRKKGLPEFVSLGIANIPGSLSHVTEFLLSGEFVKAIPLFILSEIVCTSVFYMIHYGYKINRRNGLRLNENHNKTL